MPKYNLMDNEDLEHTDPSSKKEPADESVNEDERKDPSISDFLLDDLSISDPDMKKSAATTEDDEYNIPPALTTQDARREGNTPMQPFHLEGEYHDEKLPGPNFKPFIWIAAALVVVVFGYLAVDHFFLSGQAEEPAEQVETPEERMARERGEQKQRILSQLNQEQQSRLQYLTTLINVKPGDVKYSSFLLYINSLSVEAFAKDRAGLAKLNMQLKSTPALAGYSLETAVNRPGSQGGVFTLYNYKSLAAPGSGAPAPGDIASTDGTAWLEQTTRQFGLEVAKQRQIASSREQMFSVLRYEYILKGSETACFNLLKSMAGVSGNYMLHKLALVPTDQRNIMKSNYQMTLIMDFYL